MFDDHDPTLPLNDLGRGSLSNNDTILGAQLRKPLMNLEQSCPMGRVRRVLRVPREQELVHRPACLEVGLQLPAPQVEEVRDLL